MAKDIKPVKINFNLRATTPVDKPTSIHCIIRFNKERIVLSNIDSIEPRFWNPSTQRARNTTKFLDGSSLNASLEIKESKIKDAFRDYTDKYNSYPSVEVFREISKKALNTEANQDRNYQKLDLLSFTQQFIEDTEKGKRLSDKGTPIAANTIKIYRTFKSNLQDFKTKNRYNIAFENIGLEFFEDFKEYMTFDKRYSTNTVAKHIRTIKTIINEARERGLCEAEFKGKRYQAKTEPTENIYLSEKELEKLYHLDLSKYSRLERVRDLFIIGCWTGLRFSDFSAITKKHISDNFIEIKTQKTGRVVVIPIHRYVLEIMEKYQGKTENSLPPALSNQKMNEYLKELGLFAELDELVEIQMTKAGKKIMKNVPKYSLISTHTARRSFATNMYKMGIGSLTIMSITGHRTETSFMKYIKVSPKEHAIKVRDIWQRQLMKKVD